MIQLLKHFFLLNIPPVHNINKLKQDFHIKCTYFCLVVVVLISNNIGHSRS